jgi:glutamate dehydrogenase (NAD(P)+)
VEATGRGCLFVTLQALKKFKLAPGEAKVVVQGFGNVGSKAAILMHKAGMKIISVIEYDGAVYNANGIDPLALQKHRQETGSITGLAEAEDMDRFEAMFLPCDVLVPAAKENVIHSKNAAKINARIICEGANGPTTAEADKILEEKGIFVMPDILANAGGVTVSYFEWVQDRMGYFWNEEMVNSQLEEIMVNSFNDVVEYGERHKVHNRAAAYMLALDRVAFAIKLRGIYA